MTIRTGDKLLLTVAKFDDVGAVDSPIEGFGLDDRDLSRTDGSLTLLDEIEGSGVSGLIVTASSSATEHSGPDDRSLRAHFCNIND